MRKGALAPYGGVPMLWWAEKGFWPSCVDLNSLSFCICRAESLRLGFMLSQGGEFAFVLLSLAATLKVLPEELNQVCASSGTSLSYFLPNLTSLLVLSSYHSPRVFLLR